MNLRRIYQRLLPIPKEYEKIELIVKRDWVTFIPAVLLFIILCAIPPGAYLFFVRFEPSLLNTAWLPVIILLGGSAWYLFALLLFFTEFTDFFLDVWIVTNERIIAIVQHGIFHRTVSEARLFQIQDVSTGVKGPIQMLFSYGDLKVETAGLHEGEFHFDNIPEPNKIARRIMELVEGDRQYHPEKIKMLHLEDTPKIIDSGA